jgi:hypothetical protein
VWQIVTALLMLGVFLATYELLRRRAAPEGSDKPPVQWGWLAAIVGLAALALAIGLLS